MNTPLSPMTSSFDPRDKGPTADQLALALARLERERYKRILPAEYVAHVGKRTRYFPNLSAAIDLRELIENWVKSSILDLRRAKFADGIKTRSEVKRFFVKTAKVMRTFSFGFVISQVMMHVGLSHHP